MTSDLDGLTPAAYRARYEALQAAARATAAAPVLMRQALPLDAASIFSQESIPPGCYVALRLRRFDVIRIVNPTGTPGAALFLWNADDPSERFNAGDTVKLQWTTRLTTGRVLFSDMGRVLCSIIDDSSTGHDALLGPNTPAQTGQGRNGRDNLRLAGAKFGLTRRDLGPAVSLFSHVATDAAGVLRFTAPPAASYVVLRAEQNLLLGLSNTPHALSPVPHATGPLEIAIGHMPPADHDPCRGFTPEAVRGFTNTDALFAP